MQRNTRIKFSKRTRQILIMIMLVAGFIMSQVLSAAAAPMEQTTTVVVTVENTDGAAQVGLPVYVYSGTAYQSMSATTDANGQVTFSLADGNYNFRSDLNGTQFYSGGASGTDTCSIPGCTADTVTVTIPVTVTVVNTTGTPQPNIPVYAFNGTTYANKTGTTDVNGEVSLTLLQGDYNFRADLNGTQFFSGGASGLDTCTIPGCLTDTVTVTDPVTVTVLDTNSSPVAGVPVFAFNGTTYSGKTATTDVNGEVSLTLLPGDYNFRADVNGTQFFSGGASGVDTCTIPGCTADSVTVTLSLVVTVVDTDGTPQEGLSVYAFSGTTYTGFSGTTDVNGEAAFTLPDGSYNFRADLNGTQFFSGGASGVDTCTVPGCFTDTVTVTIPVVVTVLDTNSVPQEGFPVYAFAGTTYSGKTAITDQMGVVTLTLNTGDYNFRVDIFGVPYFSGGTSGNDTCTVPGCLTDGITVPEFGAVDVTVEDQAGNVMPNQLVYVFDDTTYTGFSGTTDAAGIVTFNIPAGNYRFATDVYGVRHYSDTVNHCLIPGCTTATLTVAATTLPATTCTETGPDSRTCDLWATTGTVMFPDGNTVPIWGYSDTVAGAAQLPGPMLIVNQGDTVTINLTNELSEVTALYFQGLEMVPDLTGAAGSGGTTSYTFVAAEPGTYHYGPGLLPNSQHQAAMGMYGALIVRPSTPGQAYGDAGSAFNDEALMILSEIDPDLNTSADPAAFDMRYFTPKYWLINGKAYPETQAIPTMAGNTLLLRYINAGADYHTMTVMGLDQTFLAIDGSPFTYRRSVVGHAISAGVSQDMLIRVPATAPDGAKMALYDSNMLLHNNNAPGFGGMMTFITTPEGVGGGDTAGPNVTGMVVSPTPTDGTMDVDINATISDMATGGANVVAAEYYIDDTTGMGTAMTATDGALDEPTEDVVATIAAATVAGLTPGDHTIYVRGQDSLGNWGSFNIATLRVELADSGPTTKGLSLRPNPNAGDVSVYLGGTADDSATGNSNISAAEYFIDAPGADGSGTAMVVNVNEPIASIDAVLSGATLSGLAEGMHTLYVHSQDAFGAWGPMETINLEIDLSGPNTVSASVQPTPNNGTLPINASLFSVRLDATIEDAMSNLVQSNLYSAEFFIDTIGADGTGIPMYARDGLFNSPTEDAYALISLVNVNALGPGAHTIYVHGRDASGNWGSFGTTVLDIDQDLPAVTGTAVSPNPTAGSATVSLTASATDGSSTVDAAEWFVNADPGNGNGTPMTLTANGGGWDLSATIDVSTWAVGSYTLYVRAHDLAGNWSAVDSVVLNVTGAAATYGVSVSPTTNAASGTPGATVGHVLNVTNDGTAVDTFDVTIAGNAWTSSAPAAVGPLNPGETAQINVDVTIPGTAGAGDNDSATVTITSQGDAGQTAVSTLTTSTVADLLYFSTASNFAVPGTGGTPDDADIYSWDGTGFARLFDATAAGVPANADLDAMKVMDADTIYMSFDLDLGVTLAGIPEPVDDEDIVLYDAGTWSLYFDGTELGLGSNNGEDVDAFEILPDGSVLISAIGLFNTDPEFRRNLADEDIVQCVPANAGPITSCAFDLYFDGSDAGFGSNNGEDINGLAVGNGNIYLTTVNGYQVTGLSGSSADVITCNGPTTGLATACTSFSLYFDGSAEGITDGIDAIDLP